MKCAEEGQLFIGLVIVDPAGQQVGCGCAQKPAATPQTFWGPT